MNVSSASDFVVPVEQRYFEDYVPGSTGEFGSVDVYQAQIVAFAEKYDPQPFHVDPDEAAEGPFGGLIASGWHTTALMMRLFAEHYLSKVASLGGPGSTNSVSFIPCGRGTRCGSASPSWTPKHRSPNLTEEWSARSRR